MSESDPSPSPGGQFLLYRTEDGKLKIDVRFEGETVWLTQQHMAELFQTTKQTRMSVSTSRTPFPRGNCARMQWSRNYQVDGRVH